VPLFLSAALNSYTHIIPRIEQVLESIKNEDDIFRQFVAKEIENFKLEGKRTVLLEKTFNT
jgi:hypothetical protein